MNYLSVCSGIEAATVAWHPLGWKPAAFSEIEKFPRQVLTHHYPHVPLHGDFTTIKGDEYGPVDLLVGGTPCQSFSVAGLRKGLDDPRGNLMLEYGSLARRLGARWLAWENVPGVLSANGGRDFGTFLGMLAELGYGFAYRILDAQFFGVAQRRRRVFVVGYLGDWRRAAAVLFERDSLCGNPAPSRQAGQEVARCLRGRANSSHREDSDNFVATSTGEIAHCLNAGGMGRQDYETETMVVQAIAPTLTSNGDAHTGFRDEHGLICYPMNTQVITRHEALGEGTGFGLGAPTDPAFTLSKAHSHAVAVFDQVQITSATNRSRVEYGQPAPTMSKNSSLHAINSMQVRRLTPVECERLQGFFDNYTDIKPNGKSTPDGPRYKALGNSMAVPVMAWIGKRIAQVEAI